MQCDGDERKTDLLAIVETTTRRRRRKDQNKKTDATFSLRRVAPPSLASHVPSDQFPLLSMRFFVASGWCGLMLFAADGNTKPDPNATPQFPCLMFVRRSAQPNCEMPTSMSFRVVPYKRMSRWS